jgi:MFS family permease
VSLVERLPALRHRDFRSLWIGSAFSSISLWTMLLGNAWIVYRLSNSSAWVGVSTFASMSPYLMAPLGGMVADRAERRILVRSTRLATFCTTLTLCLLAATDVIAVWMVVLVAFVQGVIRAIEIPSDQALLANVVPVDDLGNAVALTSMTQHGSRAAGPLLAGPLLATVGVEGAYGISALFALLSFSSVRRVRVSSRGGVANLREVGKNMREGLAYIRRTPEVASIFVLVFAHCALTMSFDAMLPGFAETRLHSPSGGFTIMTFGVGAGALVGTFVLAVMTGAQRGPLLFWTAMASGVSPMLMAGGHHVSHGAAGAILMGSSQAMFMALSAVLLQEVVPDDIRGRVMSLYLMFAGGVMAFMNLAFGALADRTGAPILFFLPGAAFVLITLASLVTGPWLRRIYRTGTAAAVA